MTKIVQLKIYKISNSVIATHPVSTEDSCRITASQSLLYTSSVDYAQYKSFFNVEVRSSQQHSSRRVVFH